MACDVCGENPQVGVAAIPGIPMSVAYCEDCLRANAHPYGIIVVNTALCGGLDEAADWWKQMVHDTLVHLNKTQDQFDLDVELELREMDNYFDKLQSEPIPEAAPVGPDDPF
jgi:hypothetical protein